MTSISPIAQSWCAARREEPRPRPRPQSLVIVALLLANCVIARSGLLSEAAASVFERRYGTAATARLLAWEDLVLAHQRSGERAKLEKVNAFFNSVPWVSDEAQWGKRDYWATPLEMLGANAGDCEDYSIAKYVTLVKMGVDPTRLRITYVRASRLSQTHMVLAYYPRIDAEPLILDNLDSSIRTASERRDLIPVYSFNASGVWAGGGKDSARRVGGPSRLTAWREMSQRMEREGVDMSG